MQTVMQIVMNLSIISTTYVCKYTRLSNMYFSYIMHAAKSTIDVFVRARSVILYIMFTITLLYYLSQWMTI